MDLQPIDVVAGIAAASGGQWDKAQEHFETALRSAVELPMVMSQPEVRRWYAWMLIGRNKPGDRDRACELLSEAIARYRELGMVMHLELAKTLLASA